MRAIDVRYNFDSVNDRGTIERAIKSLKNDLDVDEITEEKIKNEMSHNGCPHAEWYTRDCPSDCITCWKQEPYQYQIGNPDLYKDNEEEEEEEEEEDYEGDYGYDNDDD